MNRARAARFVAGVLTLAGAPSRAERLHWPARVAEAPADDLIALRWNGGQPTWVTTAPSLVMPVLTLFNQLEGAHPTVAHYAAARAIALRLLGRFDDARVALDRARARDPSVLDDPDVALTSAYLDARERRYADAVARARGALARVSASVDARSMLALEVARWSMARGHDGLADALAILRAASSVQTHQGQAMLHATMALALMRMGLADEAREVAREGPEVISFAGQPASHDGELLPGESDAAVGVSHWLNGHPALAVESLSRATLTVPEVWRAMTVEWLERVRTARPEPEAPDLAGRR